MFRVFSGLFENDGRFGTAFELNLLDKSRAAVHRRDKPVARSNKKPSLSH